MICTMITMAVVKAPHSTITMRRICQIMPSVPPMSGPSIRPSATEPTIAPAPNIALMM